MIAGAEPAAAFEVWSYADDFETLKVIYDSYDHSPIYIECPDICLGPHLCFGLGAEGFGLIFREGFMPDTGQPFLTYATIPEHARCQGGYVEFDLLGSGTMWVLGHIVTGGAHWFLPLEPGDDVQFVTFVGYPEGGGFDDLTLDNLQMVVEYGLFGDLNCDCLVNGFDIDPFVLALTDPEEYASQYPNCDRMLADCNGDGEVNAFDIDPFVQLLTGE